MVATPADNGLTSTEWVLESMTRDGTTIEIPSGVAIQAKFEGGRVAGRAVCNSYFASYSVTDARIAVGDVGATKMFCSQHSDLEAAYFALLHASQSFSVSDGRLTLTGEHGALGFSKAP